MELMAAEAGWMFPEQLQSIRPYLRPTTTTTGL